jgi:hypothetical protein
VTFKFASGTATARLSIHASYVTFDGPMRLGWTAYQDSHHVTFKNVVHVGSFAIWSADYVSMIGGESYCDQANYYCDYDPQITEQSNTRDPPTDGLIEGVYFHDWRRPSGSDWHTECLQVGAMTRYVIRKNFFERCATHDIFIRSWGTINNGDHDLLNNVIENNRGRAASDGGYYAIQFIGDLNPSGCSGNVVQYNSWQQDTIAEACGITFRGNLQPKASFNCYGTYVKNVFQDSGNSPPCGSTNKLVKGTQYGWSALGFTADIHTTSTSPAINSGDAASYPSSDFEGQARPMGGMPDAGADEVQ